MTVGRIPWSSCREYGREAFGLEEDMLEPFWWAISMVDGAYREHMGAEFKKHRRR